MNWFTRPKCNMEAGRLHLMLFMIIISISISAILITITSSCLAAENGSSESITSSALISGRYIKVGTEDGRGPFSSRLPLVPVGSAYVFDNKQADLFVRTAPHGYEAGLYLYPWVDTQANGAPVFGNPIKVGFDFPFADAGSKGTIFQSADGRIHGIWLIGPQIVHAVYDIDHHIFRKIGAVTAGIARQASAIEVITNLDGSVDLVFDNCVDAEYYSGNHVAEDFCPYDGAGFWTGGITKCGLFAVSLPGLLHGFVRNPRVVTSTPQEILFEIGRITKVNFGSDKLGGVVAGSWFGNLLFFPKDEKTGRYMPKKLVAGVDGNALRNPGVGTSPVAYPQPDTGWSDLISRSERSLVYYRFTGKFTPAGAPIYEEPLPVYIENAYLYAGSLPVTNVVDWNGDGVLDIVAGNAEGRVLFFENKGDNVNPAFWPGVPLKAGGREIHIQAGYSGSIQGPKEARWGYTAPTVVDWTGDGLLDIVMGDITGYHTVYINRGTPTAPVLSPPQPVYLDGLDFRAAWRVQPAIARIDGRMALVTLDQENELHLYWAIDHYNLEDGGKLRMEDGSTILGTSRYSGGTGRLKLSFFDWDEDGILDLIIGTPRHGSIPNRTAGLPQSLGLKGSTVLFLRNVGTNKAPVYRFPQMMSWRGEPIYLGGHATGPAATYLGGSGPNLIVGEENGLFLFYRREDLPAPEK